MIVCRNSSKRQTRKDKRPERGKDDGAQNGGAGEAGGAAFSRHPPERPKREGRGEPRATQARSAEQAP
jgi:hypothetical protein